MRLLSIGFVVMIVLSACSTNGSLVVTSYNKNTNQTTKTLYSKSFDGADWILADRLGLSVVVDSESPKWGGDDSFADCVVTVYFWNLSQQNYKIKSVSVKLNAKEVNKVSEITVGAGPRTRTPATIGQGRIFVYGISTIAEVAVEMDGQVIKKNIEIFRRTEDELKRYWGTPNNLPPYPWFSSKSASEEMHKPENIPAVKKMIIDAEAGDNQAIVKLGGLYLYGNARVPRDPKRAAYWFQKAASTGDRGAMDYMAKLYLEGVGVDKNYSAAFKLFSELAEEGNPGAAAELGVMYKDGLGVHQDFNQALYWLRKSVGGVGNYRYPLAQMYSQGSGVEKNLVVALALAKYSASLHPQFYRLGLPAVDNPAASLAKELKSKLSPHDVAVSSNLAKQLLQADNEGNLLAALDLAAKKDGKVYEMPSAEVASHFLHDHEDKSFPLALSLLEPLINAGDPAAQYLLGTMYEKGKGVPLDVEKANMLFELAEKNGNVDALTRKAGIHERGEGVPQDFSKAFSVFEKAAQNGGAFAQVKIADMLADGTGVERNTVKAKFWYEQALANRTGYWHSNARNGLAKIYYSEKKFSDATRNFKLAAAVSNKDAQLSLAKMYFEGTEIPRSLQLAYVLTKVAQRDGRYHAKASLFNKEIQKHLTLAGQVPPDSLVVTLSNLDRYSNINKKDAAEFLRLLNNFESSVIH